MEKKAWQIWSSIIQEAHKDPKFKEKLLKDPMGVCKEKGIKLDSKVKKVRVLEQHDDELVLMLPSKGAMASKDLSDLAGGRCSTAMHFSG